MFMGITRQTPTRTSVIRFLRHLSYDDIVIGSDPSPTSAPPADDAPSREGLGVSGCALLSIVANLNLESCGDAVPSVTVCVVPGTHQGVTQGSENQLISLLVGIAS
jgi:hypothetical protein